jgi:hypothetical protein
MQAREAHDVRGAMMARGAGAGAARRSMSSICIAYLDAHHPCMRESCSPCNARVGGDGFRLPAPRSHPDACRGRWVSVRPRAVRKDRRVRIQMDRRWRYAGWMSTVRVFQRIGEKRPAGWIGSACRRLCGLDEVRS